MPSSITPGRLEQLTASFRALGCDNVSMWYERIEQKWHVRVSWSDATDRPPVVVHISGNQDQMALMSLAGQSMSAKLAVERPELTFPDIAWN